MTDSPTPQTDPEDREANIRMTVQSIVDRGYEAIYEDLDRLHKRNVHDRDVMKALHYLGFEDVADGYEDWAEIEPEEDNATTNPVVPDPGDASSYATLNEQLADDWKGSERERVTATGGSLTYTGPLPIFPLGTIEDKR